MWNSSAVQPCLEDSKCDSSLCCRTAADKDGNNMLALMCSKTCHLLQLTEYSFSNNTNSKPGIMCSATGHLLRPMRSTKRDANSIPGISAVEVMKMLSRSCCPICSLPSALQLASEASLACNCTSKHTSVKHETQHCIWPQRPHWHATAPLLAPPQHGSVIIHTRARVVSQTIKQHLPLDNMRVCDSMHVCWHQHCIAW